jgi:cell division protein FtsI (penicillin-binding protein 3)
MSTRPPARRLVAMFVIFALAFAGVAARLVLLQVRDATAYEALAMDQRIRRVRLPAERGSLLDRAGQELALSLPAHAVYANPQLVRDRARTARRLGRHLDVSVKELRSSLSSDGVFVYLARRVDPRAARRVARMDLPGIGLLDESRRQYPGGSLASQLVGFVGVDGVGLAGLELQHEEILRGTPGSLLVEQDPSGTPIPQGLRRLREPVPGNDVVLTLDADLQFQVERGLEDAVAANGARGGTAVVMDPRSGEILAMATTPGFDANSFGDVPPEETRMRAVTDMYEPGSVNKVITAAAAVEEGVVALDEVFRVADSHRVGNKRFRDAHPHPEMDMTLTDIIAHSSNVGTIRVAERVGKDTLDRYLRRFGFGRRTGIGFPGEAGGMLLPKDKWWTTSMGTIPIGQGIAVTPLQMVWVYATIAGGGIRTSPTLLRGTIDGDGRFHPAPDPRQRRVISRATARRIGGMLARTVAAGTGGEAQIAGYWVAGKTGTARKPLEGALGYSDRHIASFMGFLPARDPKVVIAAILDEPVTVYGGVAAAPLFREIARFAIAHLRIPPARPPRIPPVVDDGA